MTEGWRTREFIQQSHTDSTKKKKQLTFSQKNWHALVTTVTTHIHLQIIKDSQLLLPTYPNLMTLSLPLGVSGLTGDDHLDTFPVVLKPLASSLLVLWGWNHPYPAVKKGE